MTFRVTNLLIALVIVCEHFRESGSQDTILPPLPLGQFRFLAPFPGGSSPLAVVSNASTVSNAFLDRPRLDTSVPAGFDTAAIAAQGDAILAFIRSCPSQMALAGLRCPCAQPGGRCSDPYSLCNLENKCVCNGQLAYPDPSGKRCIPYVISTTTIPTTTTRPTTTTAKTTTTTIPVTTTRTTTTTTMATTTTLPPNTFAGCSANTDLANPTVLTLGLTDTYVFISANYPSTSTKSGIDCSFGFIPPPGGRIFFQYVEVDIDHSAVGTGNCLSWVSMYTNAEQRFCNTRPPPQDYEFPENNNAHEPGG